ncbi:MAG: beta-propeller domain-containing protein [Candidatus Bathyarchaeota archaeon]|nr:beta-propeller domain-containing protein [Candidatus Bathyarchaeota archaeon]
MQREIKKKTITYGVAAVLLVTILAASIYNFGVVDPTVPFFSSELKTFSSFEELENFISTNMETASENEKFSAFDGLTIAQRESGNALDSAAEAAPTASDDYSKTNIQVAGVDEADIVKTDGEYLYVVSESTIYILKAYPYNQARLVSKITLDQVYGAKIFVNGNKLVVVNDQPILYFAEPLARDLEDDIVENSENGTADSKPIIPEEDYLIPPTFYRNELSMKVYDITDKANPVLSRTVALNGSLSGVRMIGNYVYMVTNQLATQSNPDKETGIDVVLPTIGGDHVTTVDPTRISYIDVPDQLYYITTVIAVDITTDAVAPTYEAFLTTQTTSMYVSLNNMYLIAPNTNNWLFMDTETEVQEETLIYRIKLDQQNIVVEAEGKVEGFVVDQFSMDEYNGYFRVATTEWNNRWTEKEGFTSDSTNNLFVLDMNLDLVGKLENLAPDESIYATRFMDNRVYLVTFRQIDPFFVIDTSNPAQPTVLGYLKIPGYSSYLHIYDANHVIGVGKENSTLKLSLFDVTDVTAPIEKAKYTVEGDWSDSEALWDHKAFLFEKSKNLLALPVTTSTYSTTDIEDPVIRDEKSNTTIIERTEMITETSYFQGAYVFDISIEQGFVLKGTVTHTDATNPYSGTQTIRRILYIGDVLYTVSDSMVALNNLESLAPLTEIALS